MARVEVDPLETQPGTTMRCTSPTAHRQLLLRRVRDGARPQKEGKRARPDNDHFQRRRSWPRGSSTPYSINVNVWLGLVALAYAVAVRAWPPALVLLVGAVLVAIGGGGVVARLPSGRPRLCGEHYPRRTSDDATGSNFSVMGLR